MSRPGRQIGFLLDAVAMCALVGAASLHAAEPTRELASVEGAVKLQSNSLTGLQSLPITLFSTPSDNGVDLNFNNSATTTTPPWTLNSGVIKVANNTLTLNGSNTYTGGLFINSGTLTLSPNARVYGPTLPTIRVSGAFPLRLSDSASFQVAKSKLYGPQSPSTSGGTSSAIFNSGFSLGTYTLISSDSPIIYNSGSIFLSWLLPDGSRNPGLDTFLTSSGLGTWGVAPSSYLIAEPEITSAATSNVVVALPEPDAIVLALLASIAAPWLVSRRGRGRG